MINIKDIFNKDHNIIIGAVHFPPLSGYADFPGLDVALQNALADIRAFEEGGADAIIIENNYDIPHTEFVTAEVAESLTYLAKEISGATTLPIGISVLCYFLFSYNITIYEIAYSHSPSYESLHCARTVFRCIY